MQRQVQSTGAAATGRLHFVKHHYGQRWHDIVDSPTARQTHMVGREVAKEEYRLPPPCLSHARRCTDKLLSAPRPCAKNRLRTIYCGTSCCFHLIASHRYAFIIVKLTIQIKRSRYNFYYCRLYSQCRLSHRPSYTRNQTTAAGDITAVARVKLALRGGSPEVDEKVRVLFSR